MPAPTNISPATATDLGTLPASVTQDVHFAGTTYDVWYAYTAVPTDVEIGLFAYGDNSAYFVGTQVFNDIGAAPSSEIIDTGTPPDSTYGNKAVQFPVTLGVTYYIKLSTPTGNPSPAVLLLEVESFAQQSAPSGSILVPDDTEEFPAVLIDAATGDLLRFVNPFPNSESADVLDDGTMIVNNLDAGGLRIYDTQFNELTTVTALLAGDGTLRTCQGAQNWWMLYLVGLTKHARSIAADGTLGTDHVITNAPANTTASAASNDQTILYHVQSGNNRAIKRWDLVNDVALSDLTAGVASYSVFDILVLSDDSIVASYTKTSTTSDLQVRRFDAAGSLLNTYNFGSGYVFPSGTLPRLAYAADDPVSFWYWTHPSGVDAGLSRFENITVSTGAVASSVDSTEYETGIYNRTATPTPVRFGNSYSCPFLITRAAFPDGGGTVVVIKQTLPITDPTVFNFTAGGGLTPTTFLLSHGEQQVFNAVPAGSGYRVAEVANPLYQTTSTVSNGTLNNIVVVDGETTTVTFTNTPSGPGTLEELEAAGFISNFDVPRVRTCPHLSDENQRIFYSRFELDLESGAGTVAGQGVDPVVLLRYSNDGGFTWSAWRQLSVGRLGQYKYRCDTWNLGMARDRVFQLRQTDPVKSAWLTAYLEFSEGDS